MSVLLSLLSLHCSVARVTSEGIFLVLSEQSRRKVKLEYVASMREMSSVVINHHFNH